MKYLAVMALLLSACGITVSRNGKVILRTYANAKLLTFHQGDTDLRIEGMDHSTPTRAAGSVIGTTGTALGGVLVSAATHLH